jgi:crotonobetainyl-CoA:carnitine CoA-transferase CaiB-like acyl-CoA transferase
MAGLFSNLKVLDIASFIAGPAATTMLSDFGADVIKVEPPGTGDPSRNLYRVPPDPMSSNNYMWQLTNRNKRSITLNLKSPRGQDVVRKLIGWADVLVVNFPPPVRAKLHVTYEEVAPINPRLIYADVTGYGNSGPDAAEPGFDITAYWARSGLMDATRDAGCPPALPVPGLGDQATATSLYASIVTGLYRREKTGQGCHVYAALVAEGAWATGMWLQAALDGARFYPKIDRRRPPDPLVNTYQASDQRWFLLVAEEEKWWETLAGVVGHPEWVADERFSGTARRNAHTDVLTPLLEQAFAAHPFDYWREALAQARIPFSLVQTVEELAHDPQLPANNFLVPIADGSPTPHLTVDSPIHVEQETKTAPRVAPALGQDTRDVLKQLGYDEKTIAEMGADGTIGPDVNEASPQQYQASAPR